MKSSSSFLNIMHPFPIFVPALQQSSNSTRRLSYPLCKLVVENFHMTKDPADIRTYMYVYPSIRIIDLVSHTTYVVCVNFIHKWRALQFKVDSERQIYWETFHGNFYLTLRIFARNLLRGNRRKNIIRISLI